MTRCYISEQIAKHCDDSNEVYCPECEGEMLYNDDNDLQCLNEDCEHVVIADDF